MEYTVRDLQYDDAEEVLALYRTNPEYFIYCPPAADLDSVRGDMDALPGGCGKEQKHFKGFYVNEKLCAVLDLVTDYPSKGQAFIGLFMVKGDLQHQGFGTAVLTDLCSTLTEKGYRSVSLGYVKTNVPAGSFWQKNGFIPTGIEKQTDLYTVCMAERRLDERRGS